MFETTVAQFVFHVLLQSTILIAVGLLAARFCAARRPVAQSAILRVTLIAVLLCPLASLALSKFGVNGFAILPAWRATADTPSEIAVPPENPRPAPLATTDVARPISAETIADREPASIPLAEKAILSGPPVNIRPAQKSVSEAPPTSAPPIESRSRPKPSVSLMTTIAWTITGVWSAVTLYLLARLILANILISRLLRNSRAADGELQELCRQTSQALGVPVPQTKLSPRVHSPCLIGIRNPAILLPERERISRQALRDVLVHELAHLARRDCLFHLLARIATAVLFFQPLVWLLSRRLEQIADDICDDYVIRYGTDRKAYAHTLVDFAEHLPLQWTAAQAGVGMVSLRSSLSRRVVRILDSSRSLTLELSKRWIAIILLLGLCATAGAALVVTTQSAADQPQTNKSSQPAASQKKRAFAASSTGAKESDAAKTKNAGTATEPTFHFHGKIVDPDGKPVAAATVNFAHWNRSDKVVLATANDEGIFDFSISPKDKFYNFLRDEGGTFVATADGYGPAVKSAPECETTGEMMRAFQRRYNNSPVAPAVIAQMLKKILSSTPIFQLVADNVPLTGRVLDIDGQPVKGAVLKVAKLIDAGRGGLEEWEMEARKPGANYYQLLQHLGLSLGNDVGGTTLGYIPPMLTDEQGRFIFKGLGRDRIVKLLISGPGIATSRVFARTRPGTDIEIQKDWRGAGSDKIVYHPATFTHVAGPSIPIEGTVRDAKTKKPMPGVTLQSDHLAGERMTGWTESIVQTVTDKNGHYHLEGLPVGENEILCLSKLDEPYIVSKFRVTTRAGGPVPTKDVELTRGLWIEGRAYDTATNQPIRSGRVEYLAFINNPFAKTVQGYNGAMASSRYQLSPDGTYRVPGLPGRGIVAVMADRNHQKYQRGMGAENIEGKEKGIDAFRTYPYLASPMNFHVVREVNPAEDDKSVTVDFPFDPGRSLEVTVVDHDGKPVIGGRYYGKMEEFNNWDSYQGNQFKIKGYRPEIPRRVQVIHEKRKLVGYLLIEGQNPRDLKITLEPWAEISGRFLDEAGVPRSDVTIGDDYQTVVNKPHAAVLPPNLNQTAGQMRGFVTDRDGRFTIAGLMPGRPYKLRASEYRKNGMAYLLGQYSIDDELKPGEARNLGDVKFEQRRPD